MKEKHTPGPWVVGRHGYPSPYSTHAFVTGEVGPICGLWWPDGNAEQAANARLITAAPDMLDALQVTAGNIRSLGPAGALPESYRQWLAVVEAALAKAEAP